MDRKAGRAAAQQVIEQLGVVTPSTETPVRRLSGGNVQKVLLGREIKRGLMSLSLPIQFEAWISTRPTPFTTS